MENKQKYYVAEKVFDNLFNAGVVRKDNEAILDSIGFTALHFNYDEKKSIRNGIARFFKLLQFLFRINTKSSVAFHFPLHATIYKWLLTLLRWRGISTIAIIIDIDGLRDNNKQLLNNEINLLSKFKYLVAHNAVMKNLLLGYLPGAAICSIDLFDYPFNGHLVKRTLSNTICIAANFSKGKYVYQLDNKNSLVYNLYGQGYEGSKQHNSVNINYKGVFAPPVLPSVMQGSFGLIWDGDSAGVCDEYLKYNNPHKLSLYLASGLPVIVWDQSAIAAMIREKNIGITISSLSQIEENVKNISVPEYEMMQQNAASSGDQVRNGFFLKNIMRQIDELGKNNG